MIAPAKRPRKEREGRLVMKDGRAWLFLQFISAAKKNRQRVFSRPGLPPIVSPSDEARGDDKAIRRFCIEALGEGRILWPDDELECRMTVHMRSKRVTCMVRSIGPRPKGFTGRTRDVSNLPELILDAMQGSVFGNDNQVGRLTVVRELD